MLTAAVAYKCDGNVKQKELKYAWVSCNKLSYTVGLTIILNKGVKSILAKMWCYISEKKCDKI